MKTHQRVIALGAIAALFGGTAAADMLRYSAAPGVLLAQRGGEDNQRGGEGRGGGQRGGQEAAPEAAAEEPKPEDGKDKPKRERGEGRGERAPGEGRAERGNGEGRERGNGEGRGGEGRAERGNGEGRPEGERGGGRNAEERDQRREERGRDRDNAQGEDRQRGERDGREKADRDAKDKADRDQAQQRERDAKDKADRDQAQQRDRDAKDKVDRDQAQQRERDAKDKADRDQAQQRERDAKDKADRDQAQQRERDAKDKADRDQAQQRERDGKDKADREAKDTRDRIERERIERDRAAQPTQPGPRPDDRRDAREDRRDDRQDNRGDRRDDRQDARGDRRDDRQDNRGDRREVREERRDDKREGNVFERLRDDLRRDRDSRQERRRDRAEERVRERRDGGNRRDERRFSIDDLRRERKEVRIGGRLVIQEPDSRRISREGDRLVIRKDENRRFDRFYGKNRRVEKRGRDTYTYFDRPGGSVIINVTDDDGRLLRRVRRERGGREFVLIDNRRFGLGIRGLRDRRGGGGGGLFLDLAPPRISIARDRYIVDADRASDEDIADALSAPPVERLERDYTLDDVRQNYSLRQRMRSVDLDSITFAFGSWEIEEREYERLEVVADVILSIIKRSPDEIFLIEGHTDAVGSDEDNLTLSDRRAESVANVLTDEFRIPAENVVTQGYGEQFLKVETQDAQRVNRRVTVRRITPLLRSSQVDERDDRRR